jgi:hypothetical protein
MLAFFFFFLQAFSDGKGKAAPTNTDQFEVLEPLGRGRFGEVSKVELQSFRILDLSCLVVLGPREDFWESVCHQSDSARRSRRFVGVHSTCIGGEKDFELGRSSLHLRIQQRVSRSSQSLFCIAVLAGRRSDEAHRENCWKGFDICCFCVFLRLILSFENRDLAKKW